MKELQLTRGYVALVDNEDFEELNKYKWRVRKNSNAEKYYIIRNAHISGKRTTVKLHRQILKLKNGDKRVGDHRDGDTFNNQKSNLRIATCQQNSRNQKKHNQNSSSQYKGVTKDKRSKMNPWIARGVKDGVAIYLGAFPTEDMAALAYNKWAKKNFGEFANLNNIKYEKTRSI